MLKKKTETEETIGFFVLFLLLVAFQLGRGVSSDQIKSLWSEFSTIVHSKFFCISKYTPTLVCFVMPLIDKIINLIDKIIKSRLLDYQVCLFNDLESINTVNREIKRDTTFSNLKCWCISDLTIFKTSKSHHVAISGTRLESSNFCANQTLIFFVRHTDHNGTI